MTTFGSANGCCTEERSQKRPLSRGDYMGVSGANGIFTGESEPMKILNLCIAVFVALSGCTRNGPTEPALSSYTEIPETCMDKVSLGGNLQVVVNSQSSYDSLFYTRFRKPLDDYWNANYDDVLYHVKRNHPGLSDPEYEILVRQVFYSTLPFMGTENCGQPAIDFQLNTLLGQEANAVGCSVPDYQINVLRDDIKHELTFRVRIIEHGSCEMLIRRNIWILVPKIPEWYRVVFEKEYGPE